MKHARTSVAHYRIGYVHGIKLHLVLVVARYVHEVNLELEFGVLRILSATNDFIPLIAPRTSTFKDHRLWETNTRTWCIPPFSNSVNVYHTA